MKWIPHGDLEGRLRRAWLPTQCCRPGSNYAALTRYVDEVRKIAVEFGGRLPQ